MKKSLNATVLALSVGTLMAVGTASAVEDLGQCVELQDRQPVELQLDEKGQWANCFTLNGIAAGSEVEITAMTERNFEHSVNVYEVNGASSADLVGEYNSVRSLTQVSVPQNGNGLAFDVVPGDVSSAKNLKVQYLMMGSSPQIVIEMYNQPAS
ncbi:MULTISPECIES: hypothetical protein [Aliidiomarina]|nr:MULTISPECIES: hypothetical protein [Aliidiomarina]